MISNNEAKSALVNWGLCRKEFNYCGWPTRNHIYEFFRRNVIVPLRIDDIPDLDHESAKVVDRCMDELTLIDSDCVAIARLVFVEQHSYRKIQKMARVSSKTITEAKQKAIRFVAENYDYYGNVR